MIVTFSGVAISAPSIGDIVEFKGTASLTREKGAELSIEQKQIPQVQMNDTAETENGRIKIKFLDEAELSLTENTKVYIDRVYYDPDPSKSKMAMRMAMGTARFASGRLGMVNQNNINIETPTASIAVRGTDFTTTIDELGRSLVVLLPDAYGNPSGVIEVSNLGGTVTLNEAYAATMVSTLDSPPTPKISINNITPAMIDNMFIVSPPPEVQEAIEEEMANDANNDQGLLDIDFLEFKDLDKNELEEDLFKFNELDINDLDVDLLLNILDQIIKASAKSGSFDGRISGFNKVTQVNTLVDGNSTRIIRRFGNSTVELDLINDYGYTINLAQGGIPVPEITTRDEDASNIITIYQSE